MPAGRVMGDMLILPAGDMLLLNGAAKGCSSWVFGQQPVLSPDPDPVLAAEGAGAAVPGAVVGLGFHGPARHRGRAREFPVELEVSATRSSVEAGRRVRARLTHSGPVRVFVFM
jgi:hypothetical protein